MLNLSLDGPWQFRMAGSPKGDAPRDASLSRWMPAAVPGSVHHHLHQLEKIPDPYYGRNELDLQWIDQQDWEWTRSVEVSAEAVQTSRQELIFDGLDTVATIFLNGKPVGGGVNMFRQIVGDVRGILKAGKNELRVLFASPTAYAQSQAEAGQHRVADGDWRWQTGEVRKTCRAWIRKVQCHFGWDWGLYLATSGIWQSCRLECSDAPRITSVKVHQHHDGPAGEPHLVRLDIVTCIFAAKPTSGMFLIRCAGQSIRVPSKIQAGGSSIRTEISIANPKLWWPAGEGEQALYDLSIEWTGSDGTSQSKVHRRVGLRTVELVTEPDKSPDGTPAKTFFFRVNGRPVFAKGANWIPADQFVDRCTPNVYKHLLTSMVETNMNMVRVWGGGWYEQDIFYHLCDELGLMVWQDFMMACALYPDTPDFIAELCAEAKYQIRRLHSHPSIVLWNGDNEDAEAVWRWWKDSPDFKKNVQIYRKVMTALKKTVEAEDETRRFWLSSPSNDDFNGDCTNPHQGDVHYWAVWHMKQPFCNYLTVKPRFVSEFGFQSFPEPRTIRAVVTAEELNPSSRVMEHHQRSPDGNMLITNTMAREMRIPKDFDSFCRVSQINQAMAIRTAVEHWRRLRPWCMGTLFWQINDLWPVASWSSIDYHGRWKVLQHFAGRFYAPVLASLTVEDGKVSAWVTNDLPRPIDLVGELEVFTWGGKRIAQRRLKGMIHAGGSRSVGEFQVAELLKGKAEAHEVCLFIRLKGKGVSSENFATLVPWKWVTLPKPEIEVELRGYDFFSGSAEGTRVLGDGKRVPSAQPLKSKSSTGVELVVSSGQATPLFHAELEGLEGHFRGDWRVLRPGSEYRLEWMPHGDRGARMPALAEAKKRLRTMSLYDTYEHGDS